MGWDEADEEEYEITEDEKKEFANLTKQVMATSHIAGHQNLVHIYCIFPILYNELGSLAASIG